MYAESNSYPFRTFRTGIVACLLGILVTACGGGGEGRDPILGTNGNVALSPTVTSVTPQSNANAVPVDIAAIQADFSEPMVALSEAGSFTVTCAAPCSNPSGSISLDAAGDTARFTLDGDLEHDTVYSVTLSEARSRDTDLPLREPFVWSFRTIAAPPTVTTVGPAAGATDVPFENTVINALFSEPVRPIDGGQFTVTCEAPCTSAMGTVSMNSTNTIATFTAAMPLEQQTEYTATIATATSSKTGQTLEAPFVWRFTTTAAPPPPPRVTTVAPVAGATGVSVDDTVISAVFSELVLPLAGDDFTLTCEAPCASPAGSVSMDASNAIATFTTFAALEPLTEYTATIVTATSEQTGETLEAPFVWRFTTDAVPPPMVTNVGPADGASDVPFENTVINAAFSEPVRPLAGDDFTVTCEAPCTSATGTLSMNADHTIATFTADTALEQLTEYRATIVTATSEATGLTLEAPFAWSFTTTESEAPPPRVTTVAPADGSTGVPLDDTVINAVFSEVVLPLAGGDFTVSCEAPCTSPTGTVTMDATNGIATFTASAALEPATDYTATIVTATSEATDQTLEAPFAWTFTTVAVAPPTVTSVGPADAATDVPFENTVINAVFSEPVRPLTDADFTVTCEGPCTSPSGAVSMNADHTIATFTASAMLEQLTAYTATIVSATSEATGRTLEAPFVWTFETAEEPAPAPTVTNVAPADNAIGVPVNGTVINAVFSEKVLPLAGGDFTLTCEAPCTNPTGTVSMDASNGIATFTASTALDFLTEYTATIVTATSEETGLTLEEPFVWRFTTAAPPPPPLTVTDVEPADAATAVPVENTLITAEFSEPILPLADDEFTVTCEAPCVEPMGTVTMNAANTIATFTADMALERLTEYTATILTATSAQNGQVLGQPFTWTFRTIAPPPAVTAVAPVNGESGVAVNNTVITAQFNEPVDALLDADFTVTCASPCSDPDGSVSMNTDGTVARFTTTMALEELTEYTATIVTATSGESGQKLAEPFVWRFTTGVTPDTTNPGITLTDPPTTEPGPTTMVPTNTSITATFSEDMDPLTITDSSFTVTCEAPCVSPAGLVSYVIASRTAVFTPQQELDAGTNYTATVTTTAADLAGNQLSGNQGPLGAVSDYVWTFNTDVALPPDDVSVQSTDPINGGSIPFCPTAGISATFEVTSGLRLDPTTVNSLTFRVVQDDMPGNALTAESVVLDQDTGQIATFTPIDDLVEGVTYRAILEGGADGVKDLAVPGNEMLEDFTWTFTAVAPVESCLEPVPLNAAAPFGAFGGTAGTTNQGLLTLINGDIGTTAVSTAVTGFVSEPDCAYTITTLNEGQVNGKIFTSPPPPTVACPQDGTAITAGIANQARLDAEAAFIALSPANLPGGLDPGNDNLGGLTLAPGIWTAQSGSFLIQGNDLTLDGQGNQNAVWVFQMAQTLTVGGPGAAFPQSVTLINGAQAKNVFWQVGSAATINEGGGGTMKGTIIASAGVSISTAGNVDIVTLDGRALSLIASVTVVNTIINVPAP